MGAAAGDHATGLNHGGPHAHDIVAASNDVALNIQLALDATGWRSGGHHAAGTGPGDAHHRVAVAEMLTDPLSLVSSSPASRTMFARRRRTSQCSSG